MMTETLTVHEALCDIKVADSKIQNAISELDVVKVKKASADKIDGAPIKDFTDRASAQFQKVTDLINRTEALKAAVNDSNAKTVISVDGKEMTIAVAIYLMKGGVSAKEQLLRVLQTQLVKAQKTINIKNGDELDQRTDAHIAATFGQSSKDGGKSNNAKEIEEAIESFRKNQSYELVDPLKVQEKIDALSDEIDKFKSKVDSAIQMSNATTQITIEY